MLKIREVRPDDSDAIWAVLEPVIRAGETCALPRIMTREEALLFWLSPGHKVFVAEENGLILGTYYLRANQAGGGSHVANGGYITATSSAGRGVGRTMCQHSLARAKSLGFKAMQFNFVVSTNHVAVRLWQKLGFEIVGRVLKAFAHPSLGEVDALIMHRFL